MDNYALTIKELQDAISEGLDNGGIHIRLSEIYRQQGDYALAEKECQAAIKLSPLNPLPHIELAWVYEKKKDYKSAIDELNIALGQGFKDSGIHQGITRINKKQEVIRRFEEFIGADNRETIATPGIITEYIFQEGYQAYIKRLEELAETKPNNLCVHIELAWIYHWHKQYDSATEELRKICEITSDNKKIFPGLNKFFCTKKNNLLVAGECEKFFSLLYNSNNQDIKLEEEMILTLNQIFSDSIQVIEDLVKNSSEINRLSNWRYPGLSKIEGVLLYIMTRLLKPEIIVESGTWMGTSTSYLAQGCHDNKKGRVVTVDQQEDVGYGVPDDLLPHIEFHKKIDIQNALPEICNRENKIDMFFHDSINSYPLLCWEVNEIIPFFNKNGLIIVHDVYNFDDDPGNDVAHFFDEIKDRFKCYFFKTEKGIGVIKDPNICDFQSNINGCRNQSH